jgi:hypothetical protein
MDIKAIQQSLEKLRRRRLLEAGKLPIPVPDAHQQKFANFLEMIKRTKAEGIQAVVVDAPWVLGDTEQELAVNLELLEEAGLELYFAQES